LANPPATESFAMANVAAAQKAFDRRLEMNSLARAGKWSPDLERAA
jgi:fructose-bisphosphate aldolase class 1